MTGRLKGYRVFRYECLHEGSMRIWVDRKTGEEVVKYYIGDPMIGLFAERGLDPFECIDFGDAKPLSR